MARCRREAGDAAIEGCWGGRWGRGYADRACNPGLIPARRPEAGKLRPKRAGGGSLRHPVSGNLELVSSVTA